LVCFVYFLTTLHALLISSLNIAVLFLIYR
jgi:hypothetical protein